MYIDVFGHASAVIAYTHTQAAMVHVDPVTVRG
jgi:hypothetical protein